MAKRSSRSPPDLSQFPPDLIKAGNDLKDAQDRVRAASVRILDLQVECYDKRFEGPEVLDKIGAEIEATRASQSGLEEDEKEKRKPFIEAAIAHARDYCQKFSAAITQALPREMRDMIYVHLCKKVPRVSIKPSDYRELVPHGITHQVTYTRRVETPLPYLFSTKYLSKDFLSELSPVMYANATFHLWDPNEIENFLFQDLLRVDCDPKEHVRAISLVIFTDHYGWRCSSKRDITRKLAHLKRLFDIKHKEGFRLDLHLCIHRHNHRPVVARFHQILLPYLYEFKEAGFKLRLPLKKYHYGKDSRSDRSEMNQLQASNSKDPADWVVDDEELESWQESIVIRNAFKRSARYQEKGYQDDDYYRDSDYDYLTEDEPLPSDFEDGSVASDEEDEYY